MSTLQFLLTFLVLAVISSGAIVGWFQVTRGEWAITPDGKWKKTGMIFKYWSLFFEQYRKTKKAYYAGDQLVEKVALFVKVYPKYTGHFTVSPEENVVFYNYATAGVEKDVIAAFGIPEEIIVAFDASLLCKVEQTGKRAVDAVFKIYVMEPVYDWPEWIQKPLSSCPPCMSGPYGTAIWLVFLKLQRDAFVWTDSPLLAKICFYIIFLLTLACANSFIAQKLKL